jgi:hypothetical protein
MGPADDGRVLARRIRPAWLPCLLLAAAMMAGLPAAADNAVPRAPLRTSTQPSSPMHPTTSASTSLESGNLHLEVQLSMPSADTVELRYRLRNVGEAAVAVFDRGDRHAVLSGRQTQGAVAAPSFEDTGDGAVVLRHVARPAPAGPTGPTSPHTPLALKLEAGAVLEDGFRFSIPSSPPQRLRWCLGVAPFEQERFFAPERGAGVEVWQATDASAQRELCTPWFDRARGAFAEP